MDIQNLREQVDCLLSMKKADEAENCLRKTQRQPKVTKISLKSII